MKRHYHPRQKQIREDECPSTHAAFAVSIENVKSLKIVRAVVALCQADPPRTPTVLPAAPPL